jgi:hypothetical protein
MSTIHLKSNKYHATHKLWQFRLYGKTVVSNKRRRIPQGPETSASYGF